MDVIQSLILGIIQGITEFLPISSSGHLVLGKYLLGTEVETGITFEIVVHFGTLVSIIIYYRKFIGELIKSGFQFIKSPSANSDDPQVKLIGFILISMIPAMVIGFTIKDHIEQLFSNPIMVAIMLLITGLILFSTKFVKEGDNKVNAGNGFIIGIAQALALFPGISRSGSTISMALWLGIKREDAANFSFLMLIPVIAGATLLEFIDLMEIGATDAVITNLIVGFFAALISGYYSLKYLIIILKNKGFHYFAYYCWAIGLTGIIVYLV